MRDRPGAWLQDAVLKMGPTSYRGSTSQQARFEYEVNVRGIIRLAGTTSLPAVHELGFA
jgi:hypothetical protein